MSRGCRSCVNAFHGYTHNYACQCKHHPNVIEGMGLEDLETLERIFSQSNHLASVTRYASPYRRRLYIDQYFQQWDDEKYANISQHIYDRLVQAAEIINTEAVPLAESMAATGVDLDTVKRWYDEEREYFENLGKELPWDVHAMAYVEALQALQGMKDSLERTTDTFLASVPTDYHWAVPATESIDYSKEMSNTRKAEMSRRLARECYEAALLEVERLEVQMGITKRWEPTDPPYMKTAQYMSRRRYHRALEHLQRLVVQRLFELHKLNLQHTGQCRRPLGLRSMLMHNPLAYKVRTHIAKALQTRCKAIRNAVSAYNAAALSLTPPRPTVDWQKVSHYSFLDEFALLHDANDDVRQRPWASPVGQQILRRCRRLDRAREQIVRSHVEAQRLFTWIADENEAFARVVQDLNTSGSKVLTPVLDYVERRTAINSRHITRLRQIEELTEFEGTLVRGRRKGQPDAPLHEGLRPASPGPALPPDEEDFVQVDDEDAEGDVYGLADYVSAS